MLRRLLAGIGLAAFGAGLGVFALRTWQTPGPLPYATDLVIPRGGLAVVADRLASEGVVRSAFAFRVAADATAWQGGLRAAELAFPAHASLAAVLAILRSGRPVEHRLTIPEGVTAARVGEILANAEALSGEVTVPAEGRVLPQTYAYERGASRESVLQRAEAAMDRGLARAWATRASGLPVRTPQDLLIIASLVERETHLAAERPIIARAFYNRLAHGMRLQTDPTVVYAESGGVGELPGGLTRAALERPGPYNTYMIAGLPAGPICDPGIASIDAAAHPAVSDALYFVADGSGGHIFSNSLDEHTKNVARYRRLGR